MFEVFGRGLAEHVAAVEHVGRAVIGDVDVPRVVGKRRLPGPVLRLAPLLEIVVGLVRFHPVVLDEGWIERRVKEAVVGGVGDLEVDEVLWVRVESFERHGQFFPGPGIQTG